MRAPLLLVALLTWSVRVAACPSCPVGAAARERVLGPELWTNAVISVLPFAIIALVCLRIERLTGEDS